MTKNKAMEILRKQIVKLESDNIHITSWVMQTNTYLESFFGKGAEQTDYIKNSHWIIYENIDGDITIEDKTNQAITFLNDCIDTIDHLGVYKKPPKGNYISRLSDKMITFWLGGIFTGGIISGRMIYKVFECVQ